MKYLERYKIFESDNRYIESSQLGYYYIGAKHWDYSLGYLWSPNVIISREYGRSDSNVSKVKIVDDGMSNTLSSRTAFPLFKEHLGTSNLNELCEFHLQDHRPGNEFSFLNKGVKENRYYVIIKVPGKSDIIKQVKDFKADYLDIVGDIVGHKFSDKERKDIEDGKENEYYDGSWHITVGLYDVDGIKMISTDMGGTKCYILKRSDIEKLLDMTQSYNYYRFEDKDKQLLRLNDKFLEYNDIKDIFLDLSDSNNQISMMDFNQISKNQIMVKFMTSNMKFDKELVDVLKDSISMFSSVYGFEFDRIDLTLNHTMYVKDSNSWMDKGREVRSYKDLDKLMKIGEMAYGLHTRQHSMYIIFNI